MAGPPVGCTRGAPAGAARPPFPGCAGRPGPPPPARGLPHGAAEFGMSKTLKKKKHWLSKVQECAVSWAGPPGDVGAEIRGGAERGEFPYLGRLREEPGGGTCCIVSGKAPSPGDVLLEVNGTPVSGLTNRDTLAVIRHFREPIRLKTVKPGTPALPFCRGEVWLGILGAAAPPHCQSRGSS